MPWTDIPETNTIKRRGGRNPLTKVRSTRLSLHGEVDALPARPRSPLVLTVEEAADCLGIGRTVMYGLVSSGAVESVRIGRLRRIPADALVTFLKELRSGQARGAR